MWCLKVLILLICCITVKQQYYHLVQTEKKVLLGFSNRRATIDLDNQKSVWEILPGVAQTVHQKHTSRHSILPNTKPQLLCLLLCRQRPIHMDHMWNRYQRQVHLKFRSVFQSWWKMTWIIHVESHDQILLTAEAGHHWDIVCLISTQHKHSSSRH